MSTEYFDLNLNSIDKIDSILTDPLELFFQEVRLALAIAPNEIWGVKDGINLKRYLFNQYVTVTQIKNEVYNFISTQCQHASDFSYELSVSFLTHENKDLIYILMNVYTLDSEGISQTFKEKFILGY